MQRSISIARQLFSLVLTGATVYALALSPTFAQADTPNAADSSPVFQYIQSRITEQRRESNRSQFQNQLRELLRNQVVTSGLLYISHYDKSQTEEGLRTQLQRNTDATANVIAELYGDEKKETFEAIWQKHMTLMTIYAEAIENKSTLKQQDADAGLVTSEDTLATFLAGNNEEQHATLQNLLVRSDTLQKTVLRIHASGSNKSLVGAFNQLAKNAESLADAIIDAAPY
jgi:hypothetical protein